MPLLWIWFMIPRDHSVGVFWISKAVEHYFISNVDACIIFQYFCRNFIGVRWFTVFRFTYCLFYLIYCYRHIERWAVGLRKCRISERCLTWCKWLIPKFWLSFLDLHLSISNGFVSSRIYDKRDCFDFDIEKKSIFGWWRSPFYLLRGLHFSAYSVC